MNMSSLSSNDLTSRLKKLVRTERRITHLVLECIAEIDRRKLYLDRAYLNLYEFLVHEYGYTPSSALRRIESARLLREVPELAQKIESGALNLSHLSKVQQAIRTVQKTDDRKVPLAEKRELLKKVENATQVQTDAILARELSIPIPKHERARINSDDSITLTMTFTKEQILMLQKVQDLVSHSVPDKSWAPLFVYLAQREFARKIPAVSDNRMARNQESPEPGIQGSANAHESRHGHFVGLSPVQTGNSLKLKKKSLKSRASADLSFLGSERNPSGREKNPGSTAGERLCAEQVSSGRTAISRSVRRELFVRSAGCEFRSPLTQKICGSQRFLQVDHIQPVWAGGSNDKSNLRLLCAKHNQLRYRQQSNVTSATEVNSHR